MGWRTRLLLIGALLAGSCNSSSISGPVSHEPPNLTRFAEHGFSALPGSGGVGDSTTLGYWQTFQGGGNHLTLQSDPTAPQSPPSVLQIDFESGTLPGYDDVAQTIRAFVGWAAGATETSGAEFSEIYESTWFRIPTPDFETQAVLVKLFGYWGVGLNDGNHVANQLYAGIRGNGVGTAVMSAWNLDMYEQDVADRLLVQNLNLSTKVTAGTWHRFETYMKLNTIGQANGIWQWWLDGTPIGSYTDVVFISAASPSGFWGRRFDAVWGGGGGAAKTRTDNLWLDDLYLSGVPK